MASILSRIEEFDFIKESMVKMVSENKTSEFSMKLKKLFLSGDISEEVYEACKLLLGTNERELKTSAKTSPVGDPCRSTSSRSSSC